MRVKICGITNLKDALDAIDAGANALGFVFYTKSKRYIEPSEAKKIISQLPPFVQCVGLFVNETALAVNNITKISSIDIAQIHFEADDSFYDDLEVKSIKVVRAKSKEDILKHKEKYRIVDAFVEQYGGEGKRLNLDWFKDIDCSKIILAGGLNASNVDEVNGFGFYSLDVSSGVELEKGRKSKEKMNEFIQLTNELCR
ncbi:MAG TPA: phosphoribosylanthranilate isomerase [Arcobacter sp.]|nr:phosphoribosylanthranilate isomerase [Arcobacter sp.]